MTARRPRIIFVNRVAWPAEAATAQLLADLTGGLAGRGWDVHVIAAGVGPIESPGVVYHRTGGVATHTGLLAQFRNYARFLRVSRSTLDTLLAPEDIVVVMTDPPQLAAALAPLVRKRGAKLIIWLQDLYPDILVAHFGRWLNVFVAPLAHARDRAWRSADHCVAAAADLAPTIVATGVDQRALTVIPNWAPRELEQPPAEAEVVRVRDQWRVTDEFVLAYSGNLGRVHLFRPILDAAALLRAEPGIRFVFVGGGPRMNEVRREARRRQLPNVSFEPPQPRANLAAALAAADGHFVTLRRGFSSLVFPSKFAGILAAGRPALYVGPPDCGIAGFVQSHGCGLSFAPEDSTGLAASIQNLHDHAADRLAMGRAARMAAAQFTSVAALSAWDTLARGLIA